MVSRTRGPELRGGLTKCGGGGGLLSNAAHNLRALPVSEREDVANISNVLPTPAAYTTHNLTSKYFFLSLLFFPGFITRLFKVKNDNNYVVFA